MGLLETVERKRKEFMQKQEKSNVGTFKNLKDMLRKKQMAALEASKIDDVKPEEGQSDAK